MPTTEITSEADLDRRVVIDYRPEGGALVRLGVDNGMAISRIAIWLDVQARRDLIAALAATLPASDRDVEARRTWHAKLGIPS